MPETLYEGPAHDSTFHVAMAGIVRFSFNNLLASGFVRSPNGALARVTHATRLFLTGGQHVLKLYDPQLVTRVTIRFEPG
jgi:hypothetical protein